MKFMKKIYTGIDIGNDSIKMVVTEQVDGKFHVLASSSVRTVGMKKGKIKDTSSLAGSIALAKEEVEAVLSFSVDKAIITVPSATCAFSILEGLVVFDQEKVIEGEDVVNVLRDALLGQVGEAEELVTAMPIYFTIDEQEEKIDDPKGRKGTSLAVKVVISTILKEELYAVVEAVCKAKIEVVDVCFSTTGDYYEGRRPAYDKETGAIINIGAETTTISIFNKGIMIKNAVIEVGSRYVDHDICYIYKVDKMTARKLKETFAVSSSSYADYNDVLEIDSNTQEKLVFNQGEISEIVESRLQEILKLAKKQINLLTNREISYIIITGGISEMAGFPYLVNNVLGKKAVTLNMTTIGARENKYASVLGMIKYFDQKLSLRGQEYTMVSDEQLEAKGKKKIGNLSKDAIIHKLFGRF